MNAGFFSIVEASAVRAPWGWALLFMAVATYWKILPKLKEITNKREIDLLEKRGEDMKSMSERLDKVEAERNADRKAHEAEVVLLRHRLNNVTQCLDALIMLIEAAPDKSAKHIEMIKKMRGQQRAEEALEKGAVIGASLASIRDDKP